MREDANLISVPEGARLVDKSAGLLLGELRHREEFAAAVVVDLPGHFLTLSLPKLCRWVHREDAEEFIPQWRERVMEMRRERSKARAS